MIKTTVLLADINDFARVDALYAKCEFMGNKQPVIIMSVFKSLVKINLPEQLSKLQRCPK